MIAPEVKQSINDSVLCWLATVNARGEPNVSPKEMFTCHRERILIANIASPGSVANIAANPLVCVSFIDIFRQKGFKVRGEARVVRPADGDFDDKLQILHTLGSQEFPVKSIIEVTVRATEPIIAPSYWLFPGTTEEAQIAQSMSSYRVRPGLPGSDVAQGAGS